MKNTYENRKKSVLCFAGILLSLWVSGSVWAAGNSPVMELCPFVAKGPAIDGTLDDPAWKQAGVISGFTDCFGQGIQPSETRFRVCTDGQWLYLAVEMSAEGIKGWVKEKLARDKIRWEEAIEVFVAPDARQPAYVHFAVEPGGTDYDNFGQATATDHDYPWKHAEKITPTGWIVEMAIPLEAIGMVGGLQRGDLFAMNVCRTVPTGQRYQCWSPTGESFHNRSAFGILVVGSYANAARQRLKQLKQQSDQARKAVSPGQVEQLKKLKPLTERLGDLDRRAPNVKTLKEYQKWSSDADKLSASLRQLTAPNRPLQVWRLNPWDLPAEDYLPGVDQPSIRQVSLETFGGMYETIAFGVANNTDKPIRFRCDPGDWHKSDGTAGLPAYKHLTVRQAVTVGLNGGGVQRDPLPEIGRENPVCVQPGENAVIWLTLDTCNLEPGNWLFHLSFAPLLQTQYLEKVQIRLRVLPVAAPQGPLPYSCNWAHYEYPPSGLFPEACFEDQKKHYTNITILPSGASGLGLLKFDAQGKPLGDPDFSELDRWIERFGTKGQIYVLRGDYAYFPPELGGNGRLNDPQAQANFRWYVGKVREHFEKRGMSVRDFAWYGADEPDLPKAEGVTKFGQLMMQADPQQQILVTIYQAQEPPWLKIMAPYVNVWVMTLNISAEQKKVIYGGRKARYFSYSVLSRAASPYWSYRLEAMRALAAGCESVGFWCYDDAGRTRDSSVWLSRSGKDKPAPYAVIYEGKSGPVPSVRWEAWREGIQDYRFVDWVRQLAEKCPDSALAEQARQLVKTTPGIILGNKDMTTADAGRNQVQDTILRLLVAGGQLNRQTLEETRSPLPVCLTGNDVTMFENASTGGDYTYNAFPPPPYYETCGVKQGKVSFQGRDAKEGPQADTRIDGKLTDGNLTYPGGWVSIDNPPDPWIITFDLKKSCTLRHAVLLCDVYPYAPQALSYTISLSDTGTENSWRKADVIQLQLGEVKGKKLLTPVNPRQRTEEEACMLIDLKNQSARFVRLEVETKGRTARLGEFQIYGLENK
jgi:hypothetical protein